MNRKHLIMHMKQLIWPCAVCTWLLSSSWSLAVESSVAELVTALQSAQESARLQAIDHLAAQGAQAAEAVAPLAKLLSDDSANVRAHAAHALGRIGAAAKPTVPALTELLKDADPMVRTQAVKAVIAIRPGPQVTVPLCVKLLEDSDPGLRQRIMHAIADAGPQAVTGLIEALKNDRAAYWACLVLREIGPAGKDAIPALVEKLKDARPEIRREAALALGGMGEVAGEAAPQLAVLLGDEHAATAATYALGRIGRMTAQVESVVQANAKSADKLLSATSLWALANIHPEDKAIRAQVTEQLIGLLNDADPLVRVGAARGLAALPPAPEITLPIWEKTLQNADETTVAHALDALTRLGAPVVPHLAKALQYEKLRPQVIQALHLLGPDAASATAALASLIDDQDESTAHSAVLALASIGPGSRAAVPTLVKALRQAENPNAHAIAYALGRIGPDAAAAQEVLSSLAEGSNQDLALISAWALTKIDPSPTTAAKVVPLFTAGLAAPEPAIRRGAAESLGEMGTLAKGALPALERAEQDQDASVRDAATRAIAMIQRDKSPR